MIKRRTTDLWRIVSLTLLIAPVALLALVALVLAGVLVSPLRGASDSVDSGSSTPERQALIPTRPDVSAVSGEAAQSDESTPLPSHTPAPTDSLSLTPNGTPTPTPTLSPMPTLTSTPTDTPTITFTPSPSYTPTPTPRPVSPTPAITPCQPTHLPGSCTGYTTIWAYDYGLGLYPVAGFPYPSLDFWLVGPARPVSYRLVILENNALRLAFLPELGGRLYQITDKSTSSDLLYNNPVIMPTHWGPYRMTWWLQIGGVEWAFPVEEHGYAWADTWAIDTVTIADGSVAAILSYHELTEDFDVSVTVTLPPGGRSFTVKMEVENPDTTSHSGQFWINAQQQAGPGMRIDFPAQRVRVHSAGLGEGVSAGQVYNWTPEMGQWGRWQEWFSAFGDKIVAGHMTGYGAGNGPGLRRTLHYNAPGVKIFTLGTDDRIPTEYFGLAYFELWTGLTRDFGGQVTLLPGEVVSWEETWTVVDR